ncbi:MAG TPA: O-antigen polymerase, partial [Moraxella sp.]|nr:O-antigen polymerase [Moraxella sp.]
MLSSTPPQTPNQDIRLFTLFMGLAILTYLMPWHSPLGRDFVVNATAFGFVSLAAATFFWQNPITKFSKSVLTWLLLALLLVCQPLFNHIAYPDALIFPVISLVVVALTALIGSNIENKANLLNSLFIAVYLMAIVTFMIQLMQMSGYQIDYKGWVIARGNANGGRYDGNFGQANHAGYAFVLALCGVIYQLQQSFQEKLNAPHLSAPQWLMGRYRQYARFGLMLLFVIFTIGLALTQSRAGLVMMLAVIPIFFLTQPIAWKSKLSASVFGLVVFVLYYMGASWLSNYSSANQLGAVSRMAGGQGNRSAMSERAMMIFHDHVLT